MDILDILATDNYIPYNRTLAKELGIESAILFGALCGYQRHYKMQEFFREQEKIIEDTCLTEYAIRQATKILQSKGLIIVKKKGLPAKNYYQINTTRLLEYLRTSGCENDTTGDYENSTTGDSENDTTNYKIEYKIKDKIKVKENIEKKKFIPPTLEEVEDYIKERGCSVDAKFFYDYYTEGNWTDAKGLKVRNWKQKLITWEKKGGNTNVKKGDGSAYRDIF